MGEVYRADDLKLGQPVALKFLPKHLASDHDRLERFFAEVRIARQVSHPNVCRVYDVGEIDGQQYLSMEYVDGEDLASLLKRIGHLPADKALDIAHELCAGLAAAHERGVLHRDLKPSNVMVDGRGRARITDFGLAVAAGEAIEGEVSGTPAYMAPEQLAGKAASIRSDIYSLGLVLYELYTGRKAFDGATVQELRRKHTEDAPALALEDLAGLRSGRRARDPAVPREGACGAAGFRLAGRRRAAGRRSSGGRSGGGRDALSRDGRGGGRGGRARSREGVDAARVRARALAAGVWVARFATDHGVAPLPKSPEALEDRARELVRDAGLRRGAGGPRLLVGARLRLSALSGGTHPIHVRVLRDLARSDPHPWWFWYRQSPAS